MIKGLVALVSGLIYQKMCRYGKNRYVAVILEVLQISHSSPVDILSASSSCMEAALLQVSLLILSRESADLLSLLYYIRY